MKKLRIEEQNFLTLEEGCNKYLDKCFCKMEKL